MRNGRYKCVSVNIDDYKPMRVYSKKLLSRITGEALHGQDKNVYDMLKVQDPNRT